MAFYFPKDNILFTDGITVPSEKEEFIKRKNNPIIKSYKELSTLIKVDDIIELANRTYLIYWIQKVWKTFKCIRIFNFENTSLQR